jgi:hypothetical protein
VAADDVPGQVQAPGHGADQQRRACRLRPGQQEAFVAQQFHRGGGQAEEQPGTAEWRQGQGQVLEDVVAPAHQAHRAAQQQPQRDHHH